MTGICIFEGIILDKELCRHFQRNASPIQEVYPESHVFWYSTSFMEHHGTKWWKSPPESPDLNPIENLWHELKEFFHHEVKSACWNELGSVPFGGLLILKSADAIFGVCTFIP